jgi:hypothetical protein
MRHEFILMFGCLAGVSSSAVPTCYAAFVVVPNSLANVEGNSAAETDPNSREQQVYASSQFSALGSSAYITQMAFRPDAQFGSAFTATNSFLQVDLSTTARTPGGLSTVFAENVGVDNTVVYSGSITFSSAFTGPPEGPKDFDVIINFTKPFLYTPTAGNLLADFRTVGPLWGSQNSYMDFVRDSGTFGVVSTLAANINAPSGITSAEGYVTRFSFTPVPEPAALVLGAEAALALLGAAWLRWQRSRA